jgi:hypothetical protein
MAKPGGRFLALFLTLALTLSDPAFALRARNAGLEEPTRVTREIRDRLRGSQPTAGLEEAEPIATDLSAQEVVELFQKVFRRSQEGGRNFGVQIPVEGFGLIDEVGELLPLLFGGLMQNSLQQVLENTFGEGQRYEVRETNFPRDVHYDVVLVFSNQALQANVVRPLGRELQRFVRDSLSSLEPGAKWTNRGDMRYSLDITLGTTEGQSLSAGVLHVRLFVGPTLKLEDRGGRPYGEVFEVAVWAGVQRSSPGWDEKKLLEEHVGRDEVVGHLEIGILRLRNKYPDYFKSQDAGLEERMPAWLEPALGADWMEVVYGVHEMAQVTDKVAVLLQPELLGVAVADGDTEVALMSLEGNLHGAFGWTDETALRLGLLTPQSVEAFESQGYRVIQIRRHWESAETPLPWEAVPVVVGQALAGGRSIFWVNVTPYLNLKGITLPEILSTLTDLFA